MESVNIEYKLTQKEITSCFRKFYIEGVFELTTILKAIAVILIITSYLLISGVNSIAQFVNIFLVQGITLLIYFSYRFLTLRPYANEFLEDKNNMILERQYSITKETISRTYGNKQVLEKWTDMYRYKETKYVYIISPTKVETFILPKSAFKNSKEKMFIEDCLNKIDIMK